MRKVGKIDARFTETARKELLAFLAASDVEGAMLGIDKGRWEGEAEDHWGYGIYSEKQISVAAPEIEELGYSLLYELDGITVVLPQFHLLGELEGKTISTHRGRLILSE